MRRDKIRSQFSHERNSFMARTVIQTKAGKPSPFFWSDKDGTEATRKSVYKKTGARVTRIRGVFFNVETKKLSKSAEA